MRFLLGLGFICLGFKLGLEGRPAWGLFMLCVGCVFLNY